MVFHFLLNIFSFNNFQLKTWFRCVDNTLMIWQCITSKQTFCSSLSKLKDTTQPIKKQESPVAVEVHILEKVAAPQKFVSLNRKAVRIGDP